MLEIPIGVNDAGGENIRLCAIQRSIIFIDIALIVFFVVEMLLKVGWHVCLICGKEKVFAYRRRRGRDSYVDHFKSVPPSPCF